MSQLPNNSGQSNPDSTERKRFQQNESRLRPIFARPTADIDAALAKDILDLAQRQRIPDVHHHREANNLGRRVEISEWVSHLSVGV